MKHKKIVDESYSCLSVHYSMDVELDSSFITVH